MKQHSRENREAPKKEKKIVNSNRKDDTNSDIEEEDTSADMYDMTKYASYDTMNETGQLYSHRYIAYIVLGQFWLTYVPLTLALLLGFKATPQSDSEFVQNFGCQL